tara:strand:+ start:388 stop:1206 length:819 start_codon:yes stop_codon:yes gene_type:complete
MTKMMTTETTLQFEDLRAGYDDAPVLSGLSGAVPEAKITLILGPNGCGKSTLLKALSGTLPLTVGTVSLHGQPLSSIRRTDLARALSYLPQSPIAPAGLSVFDLVARGRSPHQSFLKRWSTEDQTAVEQALERVGLIDVAERSVHELSGGQRQRAWIAMSLAQGSGLMFLDEPTSALDPRHQIDIFHLLQQLRDAEGKTIVAVVHDLNIAARFADHLILMREGQILQRGTAAEVMTQAALQQVFDLRCHVFEDTETQSLLVAPYRRQGGAAG